MKSELVWFSMVMVVIVIIGLYFYFRNHRYKNNNNNKKPTSLSPELVEELYEMMRRFDQICRDHDIPYFIVAGTLLGSVRHKEFIPWDDDIDVGVMEEHLEKLNKVNFSKYGLKAEHLLTGKGKIFFIDRLDSNEYFESVWIDVFGYQRTGEYDQMKGEKIDYLFLKAREHWPNEYFWETELFPLKDNYIFNDMTLRGPSQHIPYCERAWGKEWYIPKKK